MSTAAHCLFDKIEDPETKEIIYYPAVEIDFYVGYEEHQSKITSFLFKTDFTYSYFLKPSQFIVHPKYLENDSNYDYGLLKLEDKDAIGEQTGWMSLRVLGDKDIETQEITISGYPAHKGLKSILLNRPNYNMYYMTGNGITPEKHSIYYPLDTSAGQSGSGVWGFNEKRMVEGYGIHVSAGNAKIFGNRGIRITDEVMENILSWITDFNDLNKPANSNNRHRLNQGLSGTAQVKTK